MEELSDNEEDAERALRKNQQQQQYQQNQNQQQQQEQQQQRVYIGHSLPLIPSHTQHDNSIVLMMTITTNIKKFN